MKTSRRGLFGLFAGAAAAAVAAPVVAKAKPVRSRNLKVIRTGVPEVKWRKLHEGVVPHSRKMVNPPIALKKDGRWTPIY